MHLLGLKEDIRRPVEFTGARIRCVLRIQANQNYQDEGWRANHLPIRLELVGLRRK